MCGQQAGSEGIDRGGAAAVAVRDAAASYCSMALRASCTLSPVCSTIWPRVAQYSIWLATERRMGCAAWRACSTKWAGSLTDEKGVADMAIS